MSYNRRWAREHPDVAEAYNAKRRVGPYRDTRPCRACGQLFEAHISNALDCPSCRELRAIADSRRLSATCRYCGKAISRGRRTCLADRYWDTFGIGRSSPLPWRTCTCGRKFLRRQGPWRTLCAECAAAIPSSQSPEYRAWASMKHRIDNPNNPAYHYYGGRGLTIQPEWAASFVAFIRDVGRRPSPELSLDRIDNNLGYVRGNVRWATWSQQMLNRRPFSPRKAP